MCLRKLETTKTKCRQGKKKTVRSQAWDRCINTQSNLMNMFVSRLPRGVLLIADYMNYICEIFWCVCVESIVSKPRGDNTRRKTMSDTNFQKFISIKLNKHVLIMRRRELKKKKLIQSSNYQWFNP